MQNVPFMLCESNINFTIAINEQFGGVFIKSISMYVGIKNEDNYWGDGDLAVNWCIEGLTNNTEANTMGSLLMRNTNSNDEVTKAMGMFYWDRAFTKRLREILVAQGFSKKAASEVSGSEWGMQEEGRASYDAYSIADEVRDYFNIKSPAVVE